jgi:predicted nucleotidyltransferase
MNALKVRLVVHGKHLVIIPDEPEKGIGRGWSPAGSFGPMRLYMHHASLLGDTKVTLGVSEEALNLLASLPRVAWAHSVVPDLAWGHTPSGRSSFSWRGPLYGLMLASTIELNDSFEPRRDACVIIPNDVPAQAIAAIAAGRRRTWRDPSEVPYTDADLLALGYQPPTDPNSVNETPVFPKTPFPVEPSLILLGRRGSEAHGTYIPPEDKDGIDDRDLMGLCIPPESMVIGTGGWEGAARWESSEEINGVWDVVLYDVRKFIRLLCKQNPNALSMLWLDPGDYLKLTDEGRLLVTQRDLFRARDAAYESFVGYTKSQVEKMKNGAFQGYMGAKRKKYVEKYGYDCKNAGHAVRLLHMGVEFQETGVLHVRRKWDREMIIEIKRGKWSLARVEEHVFEWMEKMPAVLARSVLPEAIDLGRIEDLAVAIMRSHLGRSRNQRDARVADRLHLLANELTSSATIQEGT